MIFDESLYRCRNELDEIHSAPLPYRRQDIPAAAADRADHPDGQPFVTVSVRQQRAFDEQAEILPYEKILVVNATNGERLETYAIPGEPGSKVFRLNGAAAHKGSVGDIVTIMAFGILDEQEARNFQPKVIVLDENNEIIAVRRGRTPLTE